MSEAMLGRGVPEVPVAHIRQSTASLNKTIGDDPDLGNGFLIGHSFFCDLPSDEAADDAYNNVVERMF
jgi:5-methylcytosine-specific restriction enzyme B